MIYGQRKTSKTAQAQFTEPERQVLGFMAQGVSDTDIARHLGELKPRIEQRVLSVMRKLGANNRSTAIEIAVEAGAIEDHEARSVQAKRRR